MSFGRLKVFIVAFFSLVFYLDNAFGAGFQLVNELSARATGLGAAMTGLSDAPELTWFNPAAVSGFKKMRMSAGLALVMPSLELDTPTGKDPDMKNMAYPLPYFYAGRSINDRIGIGLSINAPYGLTTEWDKDWIGRYFAVKTQLETVFFTPSISYKLTRYVSIGVGAQLVKATAEMTQYIPLRSVPNVSVKTKMDGEDFAKGYLVAMQVTPNDNLRIGAVFRSEVCFDIKGKATYDQNFYGLFPKSDAWLAVRLPASVSVGVSTTYFKNWLISVDYLWTRWSSYDKLDIHYEKMPGSGVAGIISKPKNWSDDYAIRIGVEHNYNANLTLRASYVYDRSPISDTYRDATLPTNDRHIFALGLGYNIKGIQFDLAYGYLLMEDCKPSQLTTPGLKGTYEANAHIFNVSLGYSF